MSPAEVIARLAAQGFTVRLDPAGAGLLLRPGNAPADLIELVRANKPEIVAHIQTERRRINHWVAAKLISWPPTHCLHCRKPIVVGQQFTRVFNGEVEARFHADCHAPWLDAQETAARRAMGIT